MASPITPQDVAEGDEVEFEEQKEHWNSYKLKDGATLQIKLILVKVKRLKKWNPEGEPFYVTQTQTVLRTVNVPKELRAKVKEQTFNPV